MEGEKELERLREQLEQAKALYDGAKRDFERAMELMRDLGAGHPDGSVQHATRAVTHALHDYRVALDRYNRFLLDHISPRLKPPE